MDRTHPWRSFSDDSTAIVSEADDDYMIKIQNFGGQHFERAVHMNIISCLSFMQETIHISWTATGIVEFPNCCSREFHAFELYQGMH
ncbi:hypothetical protein QYF36_024223 [Acer negundo]|nr:hypothetical protein QYF36_024223 [Acer negundo]